MVRFHETDYGSMIRERIALKSILMRKVKENTLGSNSVSSVMQDSKGRIWFH